jgi:DUF4097 and DUF4098 domain-containing protein YvlB
MPMFLLAFLMLAFASEAAGQTIRKEGRWYVAEIKKSFKASAEGSLEMRDITGNVDLQGGAQNTVEILESLRLDVFTEEEAKRVLEACEDSYSQIGPRIVVDGRGRSRRSIDSRFRISVPTGFNVDVDTEGGDLTAERIKGTINLRTSGGDVTLAETGGSLNVSTSGGDINVRDAEGSTILKTSGGNLELERIKGTLTAKTSGGNITLRSASKTVELQTSGGDIEILDVEGDVMASTSGGDVQVERTGGRVEVSTSGGDVTLRDVKGELRGSTSGGDIWGERLHAPTRLSTSGGQIRVRELMASLEAKTSGGDVEVEMTLADFKKPHAITLSSSAGDIDLVIPEKLPARILAEIYLEDKWGFGERYDLSSDFPIKIERGEGEKRWGRYIRGEGDINGGGDLITLKTSAGNITIRKAAAR